MMKKKTNVQKKTTFHINSLMMSTLMMSALIFSATAFSFNDPDGKDVSFDKYNHCFKERSTPVCQAFLAGIKREKQRVLNQKNSRVDKNETRSDKGFLERALEQRAGSP